MVCFGPFYVLFNNRSLSHCEIKTQKQGLQLNLSSENDKKKHSDVNMGVNLLS